jgi:hypothetical protein
VKSSRFTRVTQPSRIKSIHGMEPRSEPSIRLTTRSHSGRTWLIVGWKWFSNVLLFVNTRVRMERSLSVSASSLRIPGNLALHAALACPDHFERSQRERPARTVAEFDIPYGGVTN